MCVIRHHPYADSWPQDAAEQPAAVLATIVTPESRVATAGHRPRPSGAYAGVVISVYTRPAGKRS